MLRAWLLSGCLFTCGEKTSVGLAVQWVSGIVVCGEEPGASLATKW